LSKDVLDSIRHVLRSLASPASAAAAAAVPSAGLSSSSSSSSAAESQISNDKPAASAVARNEARWMHGVWNLSRLRCDILDANENPHAPALRPQLPLRGVYARFTVPQALRILAQTRLSGISVGAGVDRRPSLHLCVTQTEEARGDPLAAAAFQKAYGEEERAELDAAFAHCGLFAHPSPFAAAAAAATEISTEPINDVAVSPSITRPDQAPAAGIGRLDADSLSAVLSFLSPEDFLRFLRVARPWASLRGRVAAWPAPLQLCPCMTAKLAGALVEELFADDAGTLVRVCDAYTQLVAPGPDRIFRVEAVLQCAGGSGGGGDVAAVTEMAARVVALLGHAAASVRHAALRLTTALMLGEVSHRRVMVNAGAPSALRLLMLPPSVVDGVAAVDGSLQAETAVSVYVLFARLAWQGPECVAELLQYGFIDQLVAEIASAEGPVAGPAALALAAAIRHGSLAQQRAILLTHGALEPLCDLMLREQHTVHSDLLCDLLRALKFPFHNAAAQRRQQQQQQLWQLPLHPLVPAAPAHATNADANALWAALEGRLTHVFVVLCVEASDKRVRHLVLEVAHCNAGLFLQLSQASTQADHDRWMQLQAILELQAIVDLAAPATHPHHDQEF
jgi:hypothetical protein